MFSTLFLIFWKLLKIYGYNVCFTKIHFNHILTKEYDYVLYDFPLIFLFSISFQHRDQSQRPKKQSMFLRKQYDM